MFRWGETQPPAAFFDQPSLPHPRHCWASQQWHPAPLLFATESFHEAAAKFERAGKIYESGGRLTRFEQQKLQQLNAEAQSHLGWATTYSTIAAIQTVILTGPYVLQLGAAAGQAAGVHVAGVAGPTVAAWTAWGVESVIIASTEKLIFDSITGHVLDYHKDPSGTVRDYVLATATVGVFNGIAKGGTYGNIGSSKAARVGGLFEAPGGMAGSVGGSGAGGLGMPNVPWSYGQLPPNWRGATNLRTGQITIQNGLSGPLLTETVRHEAVHRWLTPMGGAAVRVEARIWGYYNSHLLMYLEEAACQVYATGSLRQGLAFPLNGAYGLSVTGIALEGAGYIIIVGGSSYGAYELSDHLLNK